MTMTYSPQPSDAQRVTLDRSERTARAIPQVNVIGLHHFNNSSPGRGQKWCVSVPSRSIVLNDGGALP